MMVTSHLKTELSISLLVCVCMVLYDNTHVQEFDCLLHCVDFGVWTQVIRLGSNHFTLLAILSTCLSLLCPGISSCQDLEDFFTHSSFLFCLFLTVSLLLPNSISQSILQKTIVTCCIKALLFLGSYLLISHLRPFLLPCNLCFLAQSACVWLLFCCLAPPQFQQ